MTLKNLLCLASLISSLSFGGAGRVAAQSAATIPAAKPAKPGDLTPDPAAHFGTLPNGLHYAVLANAEPKGRASLRLVVNAGSFEESEEQRGLAHFLEHMAFNGSTHYPPGTLVEFFQRMGMSFGGDTNAFTSFDRTQYILELANTKESTIAEGLRVLVDDASGLLLPADKIEKERGIILSEKRARDSVAYRSSVAEFNFVLGETLLPKRLPIGEQTVIEQATRERFVDFYDAWYRPELMSVVAVGDFDPAAVEKAIIAAFSPVVGRGPARAKPSLGKITPADGVHVFFHPESEAPATTIAISAVTPYAHELDTAANRLKYLPRSMANAILNRRLSVLAKKENAPFTEASVGANESYDFVREASLDISCKADQWAAALAVGEQELRRALEHGFQPGELKEVVVSYLNALEQGAKTAPTRHSSGLANELASSLRDQKVFTSPADDLELYKPVLGKLAPEECLAALRATWEPKHRYVLVAGNAKLPPDPEAAISAAYAQSQALPVAPLAAATTAAWAYTDFGAPGKVTKREQVADLDLTLVTFGNGVRLNIKKTAFEVGRIRVAARVAEGVLTEPPDKRGLAQIASGTFDGGGFGKHSADDLRRILSGKNVGLKFSVSSDALDFNGVTTPDDLLLELQFLAAKLTDPGYRPEALRQAHKGIEQMYLGFGHTANGALATEVANLLASGDPRFGVPPENILLSRNFDEVKAWLAPMLTHGAIELALVGDLDVDTVIDAVGKTIGALPPRDPRHEFPELRKVFFPAQPFTKSYVIDSQLPKGMVVFYWPTTDGNDARVSRRLLLLANVFSDRLRVKIREEMGGTYSPQARSVTSETFPGYGYISTSIDIDPPTAERISNAVVAITDDLAKNGVTDDELERAKKPLLTSLHESVRNNNYWLTAVALRAQEKPLVLTWARTRESDVESITKADLDELAKTYLVPGKFSRVTLLPTAKPADSPTPPAALLPTPPKS